MRTLTLLLILATPSLALAEDPAAAAAANPVTTVLKGGYERMKKIITAAADEMPAADYAFKPAPEVRTFGQVIAHVADAQYMFCSSVKKDKMAPKMVEKNVTTKDGLKKALAEAFAYCDPIYAAATDASLKEPIELPFMKTNKFGALDINLGHDNEHYGMIVTYLRMKKLVPPTSQKEK